MDSSSHHRAPPHVHISETPTHRTTRIVDQSLSQLQLLSSQSSLSSLSIHSLHGNTSPTAATAAQSTDQTFDQPDTSEPLLSLSVFQDEVAQRLSQQHKMQRLAELQRRRHEIELEIHSSDQSELSLNTSQPQPRSTLKTKQVAFQLEDSDISPVTKSTEDKSRHKSSSIRDHSWQLQALQGVIARQQCNGYQQTTESIDHLLHITIAFDDVNGSGLRLWAPNSNRFVLKWAAY